jgi:hypothetical protein
LVGNEALIEELQSDWVREATAALRVRRFRRTEDGDRRLGWGAVDQSVTRSRIRHYVNQVFGPYARIWAEALLDATVGFLKDELGVRDVYMHTSESGVRFKEPAPGRPPRSLYDKLPRRFGFRMTHGIPGMLRHDKSRLTRSKRAIGPVPFQVLGY